MMEENCYLAIVKSDCLSHEVTGIDKDIHNDVTNCNEPTGVPDGNSNLHINFINSDMNTINSPIQECDCRHTHTHIHTKTVISFPFTDVRLSHVTEKQNL